VHVPELGQGECASVSAPLLVSDRPGPQITAGPLSEGCLIFPQMDQTDFTGPFEVLSLMPDTTIHVVAKEVVPVRDVRGLRLMPDVSVEEAGTLRGPGCTGR
jgi:cyclohexyl-isocyanide hydratase